MPWWSCTWFEWLSRGCWVTFNNFVVVFGVTQSHVTNNPRFALTSIWIGQLINQSINLYNKIICSKFQFAVAEAVRHLVKTSKLRSYSTFQPEEWAKLFNNPAFLYRPINCSLVDPWVTETLYRLAILDRGWPNQPKTQTELAQLDKII